MAHHAYVVAGEMEEGIRGALSFAERELGLVAQGNPDVIVRRYGLLSVDEARELADIARLSSTQGGAKAIVIAAPRLFHEAQNALLKLFEEPSADTYLFLVVPSAGTLLPTMRSRVMMLPEGEVKTSKQKTKNVPTGIAQEYIDAGPAAREKLIAKLLDRAKSDKDEEKQRARADALSILEALATEAHAAWRAAKAGTKEERALRAFVSDADAFIPILHERAAPLKMIFEHLAIVAV